MRGTPEQFGVLDAGPTVLLNGDYIMPNQLAC